MPFILYFPHFRLSFILSRPFYLCIIRSSFYTFFLFPFFILPSSLSFSLPFFPPPVFSFFLPCLFSYLLLSFVPFSILFLPCPSLSLFLFRLFLFFSSFLLNSPLLCPHFHPSLSLTIPPFTQFLVALIAVSFSFTLPS